jgi:hypothetical protein
VEGRNLLVFSVDRRLRLGDEFREGSGMRPNGGAYASFDSWGIEGGLGLDEECAEGIVLVANCALLTIELREVSGNATVEGGHWVAVTRGYRDVRKCHMVVRRGGGIDRDGLGGWR